MPMMVETHAGGDAYVPPFIGPIEHVAHVKVDISGMTTGEVDADGNLKPGVPLTIDGLRIGVQVSVGTAVAAAVAGNTGNGTMGAVTVSAGAKAGVYRLTIVEPAANAGTFVVEDPDGVIVGSGTVAVAFSAGGLAFTLADGATDFASGDAFTITVTLTAGGATTKMVFGVTIEPVKLPLATSPTSATPGTITNGTLATETNDCFVAVATHALVNRDLAEDQLGRAYTAAELAAFDAAGSHVKITGT